MLGYKGVTEEKEKKRIREAFSSFRDKHLAVESSVNHPHFSAVCRFLEQWDPDLTPSLLPSPDLWISNGIFRITGEMHDVHEIPEIQKWWFHRGAEEWQGSKKEKAQGICLVSGKEEPLALLHEPAIKGIPGAQVSGAKIVSFNCASFTSYGKEQSLNAPVGENTAFPIAMPLTTCSPIPNTTRAWGTLLWFSGQMPPGKPWIWKHFFLDL